MVNVSQSQEFKSFLGATLLIMLWSGLPAICAPEESPQLRGLAAFTQVAVKAEPVGSKLFATCRPSKFAIVKVEVSNDLATPVLIDGDQAQGIAGSLALHQATEEEVVADSGCEPSAYAKAMVAAVGVGSAGLALPVASEIAKEKQTLGVPCGGDVLRYKVEELRLGKRLIMPGDKTTGLLCFELPATTAVDNLDIKITIPLVTKAPDPLSGVLEVQTSLIK